MKILFLTFTAAFLSACAVATRPPATISLGAGKHRVEPKSSSIAGYESVEFPARLTNTSKQSIWYYAQFRELPFYSLLVRPSGDAHWTDRTQPMCGLGADFHQLAPGASMPFRVWVPALDVGSQLRVEIPIHSVPNNKPKPHEVSSPATPIQ